MKRREFLSLALLVPTTSATLSACGLFRPADRGNDMDNESVLPETERYSAAPSEDVIQGIADTTSPAWRMIYASLPVPGEGCVW